MADGIKTLEKIKNDEAPDYGERELWEKPLEGLYTNSCQNVGPTVGRDMEAKRDAAFVRIMKQARDGVCTDAFLTRYKFTKEACLGAILNTPNHGRVKTVLEGQTLTEAVEQTCKDAIKVTSKQDLKIITDEFDSARMAFASNFPIRSGTLQITRKDWEGLIQSLTKWGEALSTCYDGKTITYVGITQDPQELGKQVKNIAENMKKNGKIPLNDLQPI